MFEHFEGMRYTYPGDGFNKTGLSGALVSYDHNTG